MASAVLRAILDLGVHCAKTRMKVALGGLKARVMNALAALAAPAGTLASLNTM